MRHPKCYYFSTCPKIVFSTYLNSLLLVNPPFCHLASRDGFKNDRNLSGGSTDPNLSKNEISKCWLWQKGENDTPHPQKRISHHLLLVNPPFCHLASSTASKTNEWNLSGGSTDPNLSKIQTCQKMKKANAACDRKVKMTAPTSKKAFHTVCVESITGIWVKLFKLSYL